MKCVIFSSFSYENVHCNYCAWFLFNHFDNFSKLESKCSYLNKKNTHQFDAWQDMHLFKGVKIVNVKRKSFWLFRAWLTRKIYILLNYAITIDIRISSDTKSKCTLYTVSVKIRVCLCVYVHIYLQYLQNKNWFRTKHYWYPR